MRNYSFRKATEHDTGRIWEILQQAIERRRKDGSQQWQDGYPNWSTVQSDLEKKIGFVLVDEGKILGYAAVIVNDEPAYHAIEGRWLSEGDFLVVHRVAIAEENIGKGLSKEIFKEIETYAVSNNIPSIKVDTNYDNLAMLKVLNDLGYQYCGEVYFRGSARKAFEKLVSI